MMSWSFGDPTGWTSACIVFLVISCVIEVGISSLSYRLLCMGSLGEGQAVGRRFSFALGFLCAVGIFSAVYLSSLTGFVTLEFHDGQIVLEYILPKRTVVLPVTEVFHIQEEPAYKGRWRLVLSTEPSETYDSALASGAEVHRAGAWLSNELTISHSFRR